MARNLDHRLICYSGTNRVRLAKLGMRVNRGYIPDGQYNPFTRTIYARADSPEMFLYSYIFEFQRHLLVQLREYRAYSALENTSIATEAARAISALRI